MAEVLTYTACTNNETGGMELNVFYNMPSGFDHSASNPQSSLTSAAGILICLTSR